MTDEEILNFKFNESALDDMKSYDLCAREALINRAITKTEYQKIEITRKFMKLVLASLSPYARHILADILATS